MYLLNKPEAMKIIADNYSNRCDFHRPFMEQLVALVNRRIGNAAESGRYSCGINFSYLIRDINNEFFPKHPPNSNEIKKYISELESAYAQAGYTIKDADKHSTYDFEISWR